MKFTVISDTHMRHRDIEFPAGDVLLHCGDFSRKGTEEQIIEFNDWLGQLDFKHKIVIAGNHDFLFEDDPTLARALLTNAIYLEDSFVEIDGVKIYGSPWQPRFFDWAFNLDRGKELYTKWQLIPEDTDILLTHGPPQGIADLTTRGVKAGCKDLLKRVSELDVKYHCFGHIHEGYGQFNFNNTEFINASICDERYRPLNKAIQFIC